MVFTVRFVLIFKESFRRRAGIECLSSTLSTRNLHSERIPRVHIAGVINSAELHERRRNHGEMLAGLDVLTKTLHDDVVADRGFVPGNGRDHGAACNDDDYVLRAVGHRGRDGVDDGHYVRIHITYVQLWSYLSDRVVRDWLKRSSPLLKQIFIRMIMFT